MVKNNLFVTDVKEFLLEILELSEKEKYFF